MMLGILHVNKILKNEGISLQLSLHDLASNKVNSVLLDTIGRAINPQISPLMAFLFWILFGWELIGGGLKIIWYIEISVGKHSFSINLRMIAMTSNIADNQKE